MRTKQTFGKIKDSPMKASTPKSDEKTINYFNEELNEDIPALQPIVSNRSVVNINDNSEPIPNDDSFTEDEDNSWDVERVVGKRYNKRTGRNEYLIKWLGFDQSDNSWEPEGLLNCPDLIREFENRDNRTDRTEILLWYCIGVMALIFIYQFISQLEETFNEMSVYHN